MKAVINVEEKIGKTVGRQPMAEEAFAMAMKLQRTVNVLQSRLGGICPKGVFRFKTHEEADEWLLKWMSRRRAGKS